MLSNDPYNYNTRAVGFNQEYGFIQLDAYQIKWADEIVCADEEHAIEVNKLIEKYPEITKNGKTVYTLHLPDIYEYRDPKLCELIRKVYNNITGRPNDNSTVA